MRGVRGELRPAGLGRERARRERLRSDLVGWIDPAAADPRLGPLLASFARLQDQLDREAWLGLRRLEVQLAAYDEGAGYVRHGCVRGRRHPAAHRDRLRQPRLEPRGRRRAAVLAGLGCAPLPRVVEPVADRIVVFLSERLEDEVASVHRGPRVAVTAWYWGRDILDASPWSGSAAEHPAWDRGGAGSNPASMAARLSSAFLHQSLE